MYDTVSYSRVTLTPIHGGAESFTSHRNKSNWGRTFQRRHPDPSKGEAKVLDELLPLSSLF